VPTAIEADEHLDRSMMGIGSILPVDDGQKPRVGPAQGIDDQ